MDERTTSRIGQEEQWRNERQKSVENVDTSNGCRPSGDKRRRMDSENEDRALLLG